MDIANIFCQSLGVNVPYRLPFSNGFGIRLNGSGYPFKKDCHPFEWLGISV